MSDNQHRKFTPRKKTLLNDWKQPHPTTLEPLPGAKYPAQGMFECKNSGAFPIVFKINDGIFEKGSNSNHKEVELNYSDRGALFEAIIEASNDANFGFRQIPISKKQMIFSGGSARQSENPIVQATFTIIRDKNGVIHLGYTKGDYKVPLGFRGSNFTTVYVKNEAGERVEDPGLMSRWVARAWVRFHQDLLNEIEQAAWEPPKPRDGGANNNRQSSNDSGSTTHDDFDDVEF